jgi:hypothetical protein
MGGITIQQLIEVASRNNLSLDTSLVLYRGYEDDYVTIDVIEPGVMKEINATWRGRRVTMVVKDTDSSVYNCIVLQ